MKFAKASYRVAIVGASSLLGKELMAVLEERNFPVSRLVAFEVEEEEPDLPIVDLQEHAQTAIADEDVTAAELDLAFLAARPTSASGGPPSLRLAPDGSTALHGVGGVASTPCVFIDLSETLAGVPGKILSVPFLDRSGPAGGASPGSRLFVSAHPAAIVISSVLLRLAACFSVKSAVAQVFGPVSEMGPRAIEELQKQTVNLLSLQRIPRTVFGAQLAFNLLPRLGHAQGGALTDLENRIRQQLRTYLADRAPMPALRLFQVPVFYSLALSLYVEMAKPVALEDIGLALEGKPVRLRSFSQGAPSQVEAAGSSDILVDAVTLDPEHPGGIWIWAVADNVRLAAVNAVEIAESLHQRASAPRKRQDDEP